MVCYVQYGQAVSCDVTCRVQLNKIKLCSVIFFHVRKFLTHFIFQHTHFSNHYFSNSALLYFSILTKSKLNPLAKEFKFTPKTQVCENTSLSFCLTFNNKEQMKQSSLSSLTHSLNQPTNQPTNQPINQSITQSVNQSINQSTFICHISILKKSLCH